MCDKDSYYSNQIEDSDDSKLSYRDFIKDKSGDQCWRCWNYPKINFENNVKILNPKYCWLYPKRTNKKLKEVIPNFDECKSLYTKCDLKLEACAHEQILKVERAFKFYEKAFEEELKLQRELIEQIWEQSVRYSLLTESSCCIKYYPEIISGPTERRTLCEFNIFLKKLNHSNCRLKDLLNQVQAKIDELDHRVGRLDQTLESPFLIGDGCQNRSYAYIREMISDLFTYFYNVFCQLRSWAQLIDPADTAAIEDYRAILQSAHDYEGFMIVGVPKCSCRRAQVLNCIRKFKPC